MRLRSVALIFSLLILNGGREKLLAQPREETVLIDAGRPTTPFPHFWEQMFGSGRAVLSMRDSYRKDLRQVKSVTDFRYVRFHAILDREVGIYGEDSQGNPVYNFTYLDEIYDGLLANGVKPYVELSFMPKKLASHLDYQGFWYHPIVSPPASYAKWDRLIQAFAQHLVARYGIDEVSQWYFEVWNEPNLDFWSGRPAQKTYFELYDHTARALKSVNPRLRVGGPATAQAAWVSAMIAHAEQNHVPLDFVSTHVYGNDTAMNVLGAPKAIPPYQMVAAAVAKVHAEVAASARPHIPIIWSEFNATYKNQHEVTDSVFMGPWLADTIRQCDGQTAMMSYWTFSDVFEEQGVTKKPFYGGFGLIATYHLPKPAFNAFKLLHELGDERIPVEAPNVLATRREDGTIVIAAWNLSAPRIPTPGGPTDFLRFDLRNIGTAPQVGIERVDATHGNILPAYRAMGRPIYPTLRQQQALRRAARLAPGETERLHTAYFTVAIPPHGLVLITIAK